MKNLREILVMGMSVVGLGILAINNFATKYETNCETFRGWTRLKGDGEYYFVFDSVKANERTDRSPMYSPAGDKEFQDSLKLDKKYVFTVEKSFLNTDRLIDFYTVSSKSQEIDE